MNYSRVLPVILAIVLNFYHPAHAQTDLVIIRSSSVAQGTPATFAAPYQYVIKHTRDAITAVGFAVASAEKTGDDTYMILGQKTVAGNPCGEIIRVLITRQDKAITTVRTLIRRTATTGVDDELGCAARIHADIRDRLSASHRYARSGTAAIRSNSPSV